MNTTIDRLVNKFLGCKLPKDFSPDCGISFKNIPDFPELNKWEYEPIGTNLFTADQAKEMFEYLLADLTISILETVEPIGYLRFTSHKDVKFIPNPNLKLVLKGASPIITTYPDLPVYLAPPATSQGEPVAWQVSHSVLRNYWQNCTKAEYDLRSQIDIDNGWKWRELFTAKPSTEALQKDKAELLDYAKIITSLLKQERKDILSIFKELGLSYERDEDLAIPQPKCMENE